MANLQRGARKDDLLAGLAYSIVQNYINRVVAGRPTGERIFFQGGVAFNKSVVAAFEKYLGTNVTVPPNHDVTGAIGMALIAREHMTGNTSAAALPNAGAEGKNHRRPGGLRPSEHCPGRKTLFKGFAAAERPYEIKSFECKGCPNVCEINRVKVSGEEEFLFYGGRCEKYDVRRAKKTELPDFFLIREEELWRTHLSYPDKWTHDDGQTQGAIRPRIGIPNIFFFHDFLPYWSTFLWELGFEVIVSPKTNKDVINAGVENVLSEACFPVKVAHGHKAWLRKSGIEALFSPSFINLNTRVDEYPNGLACPYTQTIPYVTKIAIGGIRNISPAINLSLGKRALAKELVRSLSGYKVSLRRVEYALEKAESAQTAFSKAVKKKGEEFLRNMHLARTGYAERIHDPHVRELPRDRPVVVIIGRAYNAFDSGMNLEIPKKLAQIGILSIPMDMLPLRSTKIRAEWPNMYWRSGQRILKAARIVRTTPGLYAIYIGNFSCGPDSFILKYFKEEMGSKPFLHLEVDEHSADAGAITRCEAFIDSIQQQLRAWTSADAATEAATAPACCQADDIKKRTFFIPRMSDHAWGIAAALRHCGIAAEMLPESNRESIDLGRKYVSGKECYPYLVTAGEMLRQALSPGFDPDRSAFFMPSGTGPCRFGQYSLSHQLILERIGMGGVPIFSPSQDETFYHHLGQMGRNFARQAWKGVVAYELLLKYLHETRPYELSAGDTDNVYQQYHKKIYDAVAGHNGGIEPVLQRMGPDFASIPQRKEQLPLIGLVGEIFVRSHRFSNEDLVRQIEALGGEVWLAPMGEWISYVTTIALRKALIKKDFSDIIQLFTQRFVQRRIEHKFSRRYGKTLKTVREPHTEAIFTKAAPYIHESFEGETILSIGKAIDLIQRGAAGIINAMPFGCMPGTIVTAIMKGVVRDYGIPSISIPYDGTESPTIDLQIEAFMEAVHSK
ncbi:MAG TPA: acyl-CoA dehydratase activase-related protein, partial [Dissulfurispiraceae bacterium]|nr:acyl-CoA dehydratase activase-related protein [Dissulfurispiraceae bacterium]